MADKCKSGLSKDDIGWQLPALEKACTRLAVDDEDDEDGGDGVEEDDGEDSDCDEEDSDDEEQDSDDAEADSDDDVAENVNEDEDAKVEEITELLQKKRLIVELYDGHEDCK